MKMHEPNMVLSSKLKDLNIKKENVYGYIKVAGFTRID